ncbi:glycosyltransferase [Rhodopila sp.]|uniref:glycosyltransferase n=1 Tax=Rhodopila sp. TaxID=2480087 RepID=UPI003D107083
MKICVVTPYFQTEPAWLQQAHDSVKAQSIPAHHILVCDGSAPAQIQAFQGSHIVLPRNYRDYGNTPRLIGCHHAIAAQADAIAFLDADNWFDKDHLEGLMAFAQANRLDACSSARMLHRLDGSRMAKCPQVNARPYIDTSCLLVMRSAFQHMIAWVLFPPAVAAEADNHVWNHMKTSGARLGFLDKPTMAYRTRHAVHYQIANEAPPREAVVRVDLSGDNYH